MNKPRRCRCRTGSATLFLGLPDHLANVIPVVGRNELRDGGPRELLVLLPNGIGLRLPHGVLLVCDRRPRVTLLHGPPRFADQLLADQRNYLDRDRDIAGALIFVTHAAEGLQVGFDDGEKPGKSSLRHLRSIEQFGHRGTQGADVRAAYLFRQYPFVPLVPTLPSCSRWVLPGCLHSSPNTRKLLDSTMPKRGAP